MKKLLHTVIFISTLSSLKAQFVFSTVWSDFTPTYTLTSGFNTTTTPGFMWCGYQPQLNLGGYPWAAQNLNIFVRGYGQSTMWASYKIYEGTPGACNGPLTQILNGNGVSMTEVSYANANSSNVFGNITYAMAGAYDNGCYFIGVDNLGTSITNMLYPFPSGIPATAAAPTKPVLIQDNNSTDFYISGAVAGDVYVMRVNLAGNVVWSQLLNLGGDAKPEDMVVYPSNNDKLIIAGHYQANVGDEDAFLMDLNAATGQINAVNSYGNANRNDAFNTITLSYATGNLPGPHIVVAGYAENASAVKQSWIYKMDNNFNYLWSNILQPSTGANYGIVDIVERQNTSNNFEFYALVNSAAGMVVLKLDDQGVPFGLTTTAANNEFLYNLPGSSNSKAAALSIINSGTSSSNFGIQVYGTANNITSASTSHMVQAYFNGETNCNKTLLQQNAPLQCNFGKNNISFNASTGLQNCTNFYAQVIYPGGAINFPCSGAMLSGSNARGIATDVAAVSNEKANFNVSPNPAVNSIKVEFSAQQGESVTLGLKDLLGRQLISTKLESNYSGSYEHQLDLTSLQLKDGVYFVTLTVAGQVQQQKLIVSH